MVKPIFAVGLGATATRLLGGKAVLISFAYMPKEARPASAWLTWPQIHHLFEIAEEIWIDSGAFTNWNRGEGTIDVVQYAWVCVALWCLYGDKLAGIIAPDVIGDAQASMRAWKDLCVLMGPLARLVVPVWHEGDPIEHLRIYDPSSRLVALGRIEGRKGGASGMKATKIFYDTAFNEYPSGRYHALGNGNPETLELYPFEQFDCTTWERNAAYSNADGFPWSRLSKESRMLAHIEALETIRHVPRRLEKQRSLFDGPAFDHGRGVMR